MKDGKVAERIPDAENLARSGQHPNTRPKDSSTLIILDRSQPGPPRFLAGRRSNGHKFMPGYYVFPGGRLDREDHAVKPETPLAAEVADKLMLASGQRMNLRRATALAVAAVRETYEETGLTIGSPNAGASSRLGFQPALSKLRFVARAITPPGRIKRFDARFFALFADEAGIDPQAAQPSHELEQIEWVPLPQLNNIKLPDITRAVLGDLRELLDLEPGLPFGKSVPFYYVRNRRFVREEL